MKKRTKMLAAMLAATMTMGLAACGSSAPAEKPAEQPAATEKTEEAAAPAEEAPAGGMELTTANQTYTYATNAVETSAYSRSAAIIEVLGKNGLLGTNTFELSPTATGGAAGVMLCEAGQATIGVGSNLPAKKLIEGTYEEGREPVKNVCSIAGGFDLTWGTVMFSQAFVDKTGFTTLEEIFEAKYPVRIVTKAPGTFGMDGATDMLDCFGLTWDDIDSWGGASYHIAAGQMTDMLKEGSADISMDIVSIGQPAFTELCMTTPMYVVQMGTELLDKMEAKGYTRKVMPANSWNGQTEDRDTICGCETLCCVRDLPDDVAYNIAKGLVEHRDEIIALIPSFEVFDPETCWTESMCGTDIHPGAAAYYKEVGLMK